MCTLALTPLGIPAPDCLRKPWNPINALSSTAWGQTLVAASACHTKRGIDEISMRQCAARLFHDVIAAQRGCGTQQSMTIQLCCPANAHSCGRTRHLARLLPSLYASVLMKRVRAGPCRLLRLMALALNLPADYFADKFADGMGTLTPIHYT